MQSVFSRKMSLNVCGARLCIDEKTSEDFNSLFLPKKKYSKGNRTSGKWITDKSQ